MSLCASCGMALGGDAALCAHHHAVYGEDGWSTANRIMCNLLHRGVAPARLPKHEREEFWEGVPDVG